MVGQYVRNPVRQALGGFNDQDFMFLRVSDEYFLYRLMV